MTDPRWGDVGLFSAALADQLGGASLILRGRVYDPAQGVVGGLALRRVGPCCWRVTGRGLTAVSVPPRDAGDQPLTMRVDCCGSEGNPTANWQALPAGAGGP